jgi:protein phosphatase
MADRWIYWHSGLIKGPVSSEQLRQLAARGEVLPADPVWPEGGDPRRAVEARSALNFAALRATASPGTWAGKVARALMAEPESTGETPDWLKDVQAATPSEAALPTFTLATPPALAGTIPYPPRLVVGGDSSRGKVRDRNEDRYQTQHWNWNDADGTHEVALLLVADGMGGYEAGDVAALLTVRTVTTCLAAHVADVMGGRQQDGTTVAAALVQAIRLANDVVRQNATAEGRTAEMGATAAVVLVWDGHAYFSHVGDCRVYLHRGGELKQLTEDQTLVARMVALGSLTPDEAAKHEVRNEVTQAVGKRPTVDPSQGTQPLARGDYLVVACDGLAAHVEGPAIQQVLNSPPLPAPHLASLLVQTADEGGGTDNCTVVVAHFA